MAPLAGVNVRVSGTALETRTDADGNYRLTTDLQGKRIVTLAEPRLDRLLGTVTAEVTISTGAALRLDFAIPRTPPAPASLCPASAQAGGALGVVRDSVTRLPISGAVVAAYWIPDSIADGAGRGIQGQSGEDGGFLLCGLPTDRAVSLLARSQGREAGVAGLRPSAEAILDLDLFGQPTADSSLVGQLRGRVVDSATRSALAGADIMLVESGLHATSGAGGDFAIGQIMAGRVALVARRIGYRPQFLEATVPAGGTATVEAVMHAAPVRLEELETRVGPLERDFVERQRLGLGKFWVEEEIRRFDGGSITALLGRKVEIRELRGTLVNYSRGRSCEVPMVMDGILFPASNVRPEQIARAEYYSGPAQVPNDFQSFHLRANAFRCGLLVLWSRGR
jgi:hypothetical protein